MCVSSQGQGDQLPALVSLTGFSRRRLDAALPGRLLNNHQKPPVRTIVGRDQRRARLGQFPRDGLRQHTMLSAAIATCRRCGVFSYWSKVDHRQAPTALE